MSTFSFNSSSLSFILSSNSFAALFVKVVIIIFLASTFLLTMIFTVLSTRVFVLPVPGPAIITTGPLTVSTASNCFLFKSDILIS